MKCVKCNRDNRDKAKFCKYCGSSLAAGKPGSPGLDTIIGKRDAAEWLRATIASAEAIKRQGQQQGSDMRARLCFAFTGVSGCGKSFLAKAFAAEMFRAGITDRPDATVIKSADYNKFVEKLDDNIKPIKGNVLVIDEAQKLCPATRADSVTELDSVLQRCRDWCDDTDKPIVLFLGDEQLTSFFENNPAARAMIQDLIELPKPTIEDVTAIAVAEFQNLGFTVPQDTAAKISRVITATKRRDIDKFDYGHCARNMAYDVFSRQAANGIGTVTPEMIEGEEFVPKTLDQVMKSFDKYVGVEDIKNAIREIAQAADDARSKGLAPNEVVQNHYVFKGNPGTGKTTMARLFAEALQAMGVLSSGHIVEVDREKLVSNYVGETPKLVRKAVNDALGGVLFIDEAYALWRDKDDKEGQQVVDTLLKDCEDLRGKFVCLIAGYPVEMDRFLGSNPGLPRRFNKTIIFRDYTGPELTQIFRNMATGGKNPVKLGDDVEQQIGAFFDKIYLTRTKRFGNAGTVRNILTDAIDRMRKRIQKAKDDGTFRPEDDNVLIMADLQEDEVKTVDQILNSFDDLIGMSDVKEQIRSIARSVEMQQKLVELGIGESSVTNIHIILTGNPGTGKTTVAMRLGQVFKAMGVIPTDRVVVKKSEDIFDSYKNSAGPNMTQAVDDAMGGVLFIDEAYNLLPMRAPGQVDQDGSEAIAALMTCMSERAGQFITVIAGYKTEIDEFIRNANPGLARRFTHRIHIPDYSAADLTTIFLQQVSKAKMKITEDAQKLLERKIEELVTAKDEKFGNAGTIVNLFKEARDKHFNNVTTNDEVERLITFYPEDIPYDAPKRLDMDEIMAKLDHLEGLQGVKTAIRDLADTLLTLQARAADSGEKASINLDHYLFLGNPGTGKTTVARIMGDIFYSLGLLPSNKVIELSAKDLKAPYIGQTAPLAHAAMMRGMGGVVFIDEAYSITQGEGETGFGKEAVSEILQVMENYKNKFITIAAGYPREMAEWLDSNSGLSSRFTATITFDDYNADELSRIAANMFEKKNLKLMDAAFTAMHNYFVKLTTHKSRNFANAREARNFVDKVLINQGRRLRQEMKLPDFDRNRFYILEPADMQV